MCVCNCVYVHMRMCTCICVVCESSVYVCVNIFDGMKQKLVVRLIVIFWFSWCKTEIINNLKAQTKTCMGVWEGCYKRIQMLAKLPTTEI